MPYKDPSKHKEAIRRSRRKYRRKRRVEKYGYDAPDQRGRHGNHVRSSNHYRWNGSTIISSSGYVRIRVGVQHPLADPNGYAAEHTLVWVSAGGTLKDGEVLHHINGNKQDNRWENLQKLTKAEHNRIHLPPRNPITGRFIGKKRAGRLLDGRTWNEMPGRAR